MPKQPTFAVMLAWWAATLLAGCTPFGKIKADRSSAGPPPPPDVAGTVGEFAGVVGGGGLLVDGHGLVVGLGRNGSTEAPPAVKEQIAQYMLKMKVSSPTAGTAGATPSDIIADKDTAVVRFVSIIPPGAPAGHRIDVQIAALSRTGTKSLDGGVLLPWPMYVAAGEEAAPELRSRAWARAEGSVFVNPYLDPTRRGDAPRLREGRLIGGGTVLYSRPLSLALREADYQRCDLIQRRINQRFGERRRVAFARSSSLVEIKVPREHVQDYQHFIELLLHLPISGESQEWEVHARRIAEEMLRPAVNHDGLALVLEAMGPQVVPICRTLYASRNLAAAFHAARTGARLGDDTAGDVLLRLAQSPGCPYQVAAIEEVGRQSRLARCVPALRTLLDGESELVRVAAYEALLALGDYRTVTRVDVGGEFFLDLVTCRRAYVIYATQSIEKRIVLFGRDMGVARRVFFNMPGDLVTIWDKTDPNTGQGKLMVYRTIPRTGGISDALAIDFRVQSLIETLGRSAEINREGRITGLGLTYGQVVAVLARMCDPKMRDIPARFILQRPAMERKIYVGTPTAGRPDMPPD